MDACQHRAASYTWQRIGFTQVYEASLEGRHPRSPDAFGESESIDNLLVAIQPASVLGQQPSFAATAALAATSGRKATMP